MAGVAVRAAADLFIVDVTKYLSVRPRFQNCESFELTVRHDSKDPHAAFEVSSRLFNCDSDITLNITQSKYSMSLILLLCTCYMLCLYSN